MITTETTNNETVQDANEEGVDEEPWQRHRGPLTRPDGRVCIGRVGAPQGQEATSTQFFFWVPEGALVETTQLVTCESHIAGRSYTFYAIVEETHRRSRKRDMGDEEGESDGDLASIPPFQPIGYTFARAGILRTSPPVLTSPRERSDVMLAGPAEAPLAYGADEIEHPLEVGLIKNGGNHVAGAGVIDLDYLLGTNGGHLNVNGAAGRGTKSSFLLFIMWMLLRLARQQKRERPSAQDRLRIVPIILNVKNFDLFYIDCWSKRYRPDVHGKTWQMLGIDEPQPFQNVTFYAAQQPGGELPVPTGRLGDVHAYSWSLRDIIERGLFSYLFAETDTSDANFGALVLDIENFLTGEKMANDGATTRFLRSDTSQPPTFDDLRTWVDTQARLDDASRALHSHHPATWKKLHRRLIKLTYESKGVLRRGDSQGNPLDLVRADSSDPIVVDLAALATQPALQRFVVATIFRQLVEACTGSSAVRGLVYLIMLDELNRFAPHGARDPITQLIELVATEMRSQGIILLGAQQKASKVSEKVIENAGIRALGKTGSLELSTPVWRFLSMAAQRKADVLPPDEKLVIQDNFREPMHVRVPFPVWAMNPSEAADSSRMGATKDKSELYHDVIDA